MLNPLIAMPGSSEWLIILAIVVLIFGASKLPELARGTGQALRIFKAETKGLRDDKSDDAPVKPAATELPPTPAPATDETTVEDRQRDTHNG